MTLKLIIVFLFIINALSAQQSNSDFTINEKSQCCNKAHDISKVRKTSHTNLQNENMQNYDLVYMDLEIETGSSTYIIASAMLNVKVLSDEISSIMLDFNGKLLINEVYVDGTISSWTFNNNVFEIQIQESYSTGDIIEIIINYEGDGHDSDAYAGGLHYRIVEDKPLLYSFTQPYDASIWFPCKQDNRDKIDSVQISVITDNSKVVSSIGNLISKESLADNKARFTWKTNYPTAYYLIAFNVYDYFEYYFKTKPLDSFPDFYVRNYLVDFNHYNSYKDILDKTDDAMKLFSNHFGMYPFYKEKYGHSIWGHSFGMEHQTLTSMPVKIDFRRLSHELSHQWFGNHVTCATWQDIWLNEGFASFLDYYALYSIISESEGKSRLEYYHKKARNNTTGSLYVPFNEVNDASRVFQYSLTYCKGAVVVDMLRHELQDDEKFWDALKFYLEKFAGSSATSDDLKLAIEEFTSTDLTYFFDQWVYGEGYPSYSGKWYQKDDSLHININQSATSFKTPFFKMHVPFNIYTENGIKEFDSWNTFNEQDIVIYMPDIVIGVKVDPDDVILGIDKSFVKVIPIGKPDRTNIQEINILYYNNSLEINIENQFSYENYTVEVYDFNGRVILKQSISSSTKINCNHLSYGMYQVVVYSDNVIETKKIFVN